MACKNKLSHLKFLKSLNKLLIITAVVAILLTGVLVLILLLQNKLSSSINSIINCLVITLPISLFILCIVASILFKNKLSKKSARIQNLSCLESLSNVDVLVVDKNGTLTNGELEIKKIVPLKAVATEEYIAQWVSNVLRATNDNNVIANALSKEYDLELSAGVISISSFSGGRQYFGASFKGGKNIIIGSPKHIPVKNEIGILKRCEEYINSGYRILVLAEGKELVNEEEYQGELEAVALIILKDQVRDHALETFKWFKSKGVDIKVISSKDPVVTSVIAAEVGIDNADKYISVEGMSFDEIKEIANTYTVFGKASKEQKETLIKVIKQNNKKVAMIGDDHSELLAMKSADCAIAVHNSDTEVKETADIVLSDPSLAPLVATMDETNTFINNMSKVAVLCISRLLFAFVLVIGFIFATLFSKESLDTPFMFNHFLICDLITNGIAAFLLAIENNNEKLDESFLKVVFKKAIPASIVFVISVAVILLLYVLETNQLLNLGIYSISNIVTISALAIYALSLVNLYTVCSPLNQFRKIVLVGAVSLNVLILFIDILVTYLTNKTGIIFQLPYLEMNGPAYMSTAIIVIAITAVSLFVQKIIIILKGGDVQNED